MSDMQTGVIELSKEWLEKYETFKQLREKAYAQIERGLRLENEQKIPEAIASYELGLDTINEALAVYLVNVDHEYWDRYYENAVKMKTTRKEILERLAVLRTPNMKEADPNVNRATDLDIPGLNPTAPLLSPPSYEEAMSLSSDNSPSSLCPYTRLNDTLTEMRIATQGNLIYTQENVRMYFISPDGSVGSLSNPATLSIIQYEDCDTKELQYYLQVADWIYPLLAGLSPILHSDFGAFILPDVHSPVEGSAIGLILPVGSESSVYEILDDIIKGIQQQVKLRKPPPRPPPPQVPTPPEEPATWSQRISQGIITGAQYVSAGLIKGAEMTSEFINTNTPKIMAKIQPDPEPKPVSPTVQKGVSIARSVTGSAVKVTGYVATKIGSATMALGRMIAPTIQTQGTKVISSVSGVSEQSASNTVGSALEVTAGAVQGFGTVYVALEKSALILARSLKENTVQIVQHKYGQPMGEITGDTMQTVGNTAIATYTASSLTVKGIAKRAAKNAGKAVLEDYGYGKTEDIANGNTVSKEVESKASQEKK